MPPRQRVFFPEPQAPKLLSRSWIWFFRLLIAFSACAFVTAACGTWVLSGMAPGLRQAQQLYCCGRWADSCCHTDHDKKNWVSNTTFAEYWRALIAWNQVCHNLSGKTACMYGSCHSSKVKPSCSNSQPACNLVCVQVVNGVTFNGGMFGIMIGFTRLYQHNQAVKQLVCPAWIKACSRWVYEHAH